MFRIYGVFILVTSLSLSMHRDTGNILYSHMFMSVTVRSNVLYCMSKYLSDNTFAFIIIKLSNLSRDSMVTLSMHSSTVPGMFLTLSYCKPLYMFSSCFFSPQHASRWTGYIKLPVCVNKCVNVCVHDVLWWTCIPFRVYSCLHTKCSWNSLQLHCQPYQDKVVSED